jgi:hypothetical protein
MQFKNNKLCHSGAEKLTFLISMIGFSRIDLDSPNGFVWQKTLLADNPAAPQI